MDFEKIKAFVREKAKRSKFFEEDFEIHTRVVVKLVEKLAGKYDADGEVVKTAAYLHDIGKIDAKSEEELKQHHFRSAEIAENFLRDLGCKSEFIEKVKTCIIEHRTSENKNPSSSESLVLQIADAWSLFKSSFLLARLTKFLKISESLNQLREKLNRNLKFLKKRDLEVYEECKEIYECLIKLINTYEKTFR